MLSPYVLFPTKPVGTDDGDDILLTLKDGFHFVVKGHGKLAALQIGNAGFAESFLTNEDTFIFRIGRQIDIVATEFDPNFENTQMMLWPSVFVINLVFQTASSI